MLLEKNQVEITYEAGVDEVLHPDLAVAMRLVEWSISECPYGCKIYADPRSRLRVLAHSRTYGCPVTHKEISDGQEEPPRAVCSAEVCDRDGGNCAQLAGCCHHHRGSSPQLRPV